MTEDEFLPLFDQYHNTVYRIALVSTRSKQDAEDIVQTVFLKLLQQPSLEPGKEKQWLLRVTANECKSLLRCAWWRKTAPLEAAAGETGSGAALSPNYLRLSQAERERLEREKK